MVNIVLIDDDSVSAFVTEKLIFRNINEPCKVFKFGNAKEALNNLETIDPDYLFLDLMMPEMDGWEFLDAYQTKGKYRAKSVHPEIYILSSSIRESDMDRVKNYSQVKKYLFKPSIKSSIRDIFN